MLSPAGRFVECPKSSLNLSFDGSISFVIATPVAITTAMVPVCYYDVHVTVSLKERGAWWRAGVF